MFVVSVVCCQVEVSVTDCSLVQRSHTNSESGRVYACVRMCVCVRERVTRVLTGATTEPSVS